MLKLIEIEGVKVQIVGYYNDKDHLLVQYLDAEVPEKRRIFPPGSPFAVVKTMEVVNPEWY